MSKVLHLNLKKEYFDAIKAGDKQEEYRLLTAFWQKRLKNRHYDEIHIKCGYPKAGDVDRTVIRPWRGYKIKKINHPHFGDKPVEVFAIKVN